MCGDWWDTYYNLLNGYALHGYVLVGYVWVGYVWNGYVWDMCDVLDMCGICVVDTFGMDMCGICVMCWICVGYVWCEIRKQSSEEPCDETSFGLLLLLASWMLTHRSEPCNVGGCPNGLEKHLAMFTLFWTCFLYGVFCMHLFQTNGREKMTNFYQPTSIDLEKYGRVCFLKILRKRVPFCSLILKLFIFPGEF